MDAIAQIHRRHVDDDFGRDIFGQASDDDIASGRTQFTTEANADGFTVENNLFIMDKVNAADLGAGSIVWLPAFKNNTYIQKYGNTLTNVGENGGKRYTMDGKAAENLEAGYGEKGAQLYYVPADTVVE